VGCSPHRRLSAITISMYLNVHILRSAHGWS
jgi:hypothetical protein